MRSVAIPLATSQASRRSSRAGCSPMLRPSRRPRHTVLRLDNRNRARKAKRMLTAKARGAHCRLAQAHPKSHFRQRHLTTQASGP
jgi:hypothetical protein